MYQSNVFHSMYKQTNDNYNNIRTRYPGHAPINKTNPRHLINQVNCPLISTTRNKFLRSTSNKSNDSLVLIRNFSATTMTSTFLFCKNSTVSASLSNPNSSVRYLTSISGRYLY